MEKSLTEVSLRIGCLCNKLRAISGEGLLWLENKTKVWSDIRWKSTYFRLVSEAVPLAHAFTSVKVFILKSPAVPKAANFK
jgi:hypothetical protein